LVGDGRAEAGVLEIPLSTNGDGKPGWIVGDDKSGVRITREGLTALGDFEPLPTGRGLLEYWQREFGVGAAGQILRTIAAAYPQALTYEEIGERANVSTKGGSFGTYLSRLRSRDVIENAGRQQVRLAEDLAAQVALAVENARLYEDARVAIELRDKFLTIAAHELKTPMTSNQGYSQLLSRQLDQGLDRDAAPVSRAARMIEDRTRHLARLVEQILDVSRLVSARMELNRNDTDLVAVIKNLVIVFERQRGAHEFRLHLRHERLQAVVDPLRIQQVMAGLAGALVLPKTYGARAEILYSIGKDQQGGDPLKQDRQLSTQLVYLKSRAVLGPVAQKQGRQFKDLDEDLSVQVLDNSEVIQVEAHGVSKLAAMQTLQAVMDGYLTLIGQPTGVSRNLDTQLADAHLNTTRIQTQVTQLTTAVLAGTATQTSLNDARAQLTVSLDREKAIQARIDELKLTGQAGPDAQLLTPPYSLPDAVFPQPLIAAGTGALVGLIVAGGVVAVGARRRTRP